MKKEIRSFISATLISLIVLMIQLPTLAGPSSALRNLRRIWNTLDDGVMQLDDQWKALYNSGKGIYRVNRLKSIHRNKLDKIGKKYALQYIIDNYNQELTPKLLDIVEQETLKELYVQNKEAERLGYGLSDVKLTRIAARSREYAAQTVMTEKQNEQTEQTN